MGAGYIVIIGLLAATADDPSALAFVRNATVVCDEVALGDIADVTRLPPGLRERAAVLPVARLRAGQGHVVLAARRVAERARALMPALGPWLTDPTDLAVTVRRGGPTARGATATAACARLERPVAAGAVPAEQDLTPAACGAEPSLDHTLRYDTRIGMVRAARDLKAGETVISPPAFALAQVTAGQRLHVRAQVGSVTVQRDVEAVRTARAGPRLFVRTADGAVFSARSADLTP